MAVGMVVVICGIVVEVRIVRHVELVEDDEMLDVIPNVVVGLESNNLVAKHVKQHEPKMRYEPVVISDVSFTKKVRVDLGNVKVVDHTVVIIKISMTVGIPNAAMVVEVDAGVETTLEAGKVVLALDDQVCISKRQLRLRDDRVMILNL